MKANVAFTFLVAVLALATAIPGVKISASPNPQVKSGVDRLYVIDCGDGSGPDESRWTPGANVGIRLELAGCAQRHIAIGYTPTAVTDGQQTSLCCCFWVPRGVRLRHKS